MSGCAGCCGSSGRELRDGARTLRIFGETLVAARLPSVRALHLVDRTAIPWQAKDIGRETLVRYHLGKTLLGLPFVAERRNALYRKLEGSLMDLAPMRRSHPSLKGVVPTLASLLAERKN